MILSRNWISCRVKIISLIGTFHSINFIFVIPLVPLVPLCHTNTVPHSIGYVANEFKFKSKIGVFRRTKKHSASLLHDTFKNVNTGNA